MHRYPIISVANSSSVVADDVVEEMVHALQWQINHDWRPFWDSFAHLVFVPKGKKPHSNTWLVTIEDTSDVAGAVGYHWQDNGMPAACVFAKDDLDFNMSVSITLGHEILEMLADPYIYLGAQVTNSRWIGYEVCDPVEADRFGYFYQGVPLTNFVTPSWFDPSSSGLIYDAQGVVNEPLQVLEGGYISYYENGGWHQAQMRNGDFVPVELENSSRFRDRNARTS